MIFFILAALLIIEQSYNHLTFLVVVFFNTVIGIFQEIRAKKTLEKLSLISAPLSTVIRDGKEETVSSDELVLDDIVVFEATARVMFCNFRTISVRVDPHKSFRPRAFEGFIASRILRFGMRGGGLRIRSFYRRRPRLLLGGGVDGCFAACRYETR